MISTLGGLKAANDDIDTISNCSISKLIPIWYSQSACAISSKSIESGAFAEKLTDTHTVAKCWEENTEQVTAVDRAVHRVHTIEIHTIIKIANLWSGIIFLGCSLRPHCVQDYNSAPIAWHRSPFCLLNFGGQLEFPLRCCWFPATHIQSLTKFVYAAIF